MRLMPLAVTMMLTAFLCPALHAAGGEKPQDQPAAQPAATPPWSGPSVALSHGDLKVAENRRYLVHADGTPFFYLGDTAWELFHRLDRAEAEKYLENRRAKGFTVIQAVALAELDGLGVPNAYGHVPLVENDPARPAVVDGPENDYWDHVDFIVNAAAARGMFIGLLPTWGDKWNKKWGRGPEIFTPENAAAYGEWLGRRYADKPIIWILGGDRPIESDAQRAVIRAMAAGLKRGDGGRHLMTFHPMGGKSSSAWFHADAWLDFNMLQSGHAAKDLANYAKVAADYALTPVKPCLDGEPRYDDHPVRGQKTREEWFDTYDVRQAAWWAVLAGGLGHTYGCHPIWMMRHPRMKDAKWPSPVRHYWDEVLDLPGAWQMLNVRRLMESRPMLDRVPDQSLIVGDAGTGADHVQSARGKDHAFIYVPTGKPVTVALGKTSGKQVKAWWFDPRTGTAAAIGEFANEGTREFDPPGDPVRGNDWVLVLDDAEKKYPAPGGAAARR